MIDIAKLAPSLKTNPILLLIELINNSEAEFNRLVLEIQESCPHTENNKNWERPNRPFDQGELLSTECKSCGLVRNKPKGWDYQICIKCWSPMQDNGSGFMGEDRAHFYKCTKCSNTAFHT